jgi:site-specific DNA-methyltransferase (adenine-specific)
MNEQIQLWHGDCLELMADIPDGSVDMVLADPPYGTTACKWDSIIPLEPMWEHLRRIIKPNGAIVMTASQPFTTTLIASNMKMFKYCWVWIKNRPTGAQHARNKPMSKYEDIAVFSRGSMGHKSLLGACRMQYNPQSVVDTGKTKVVKEKGFHGRHIGKRPNQVGRKYRVYTGFPSNVLYFAKEESHFHPTQKPVALMEYMIRTYTNPGELVLDFVMGSGTTGVACVNTGRKFIGIELDKNYYEIACKRINDALWIIWRERDED